MSDNESGNDQQNPDGSWTPAQPLGWQEEHGHVQRAILWLVGREHCNEREGQKRSRRLRSGPSAAKPAKASEVQNGTNS